MLCSGEFALPLLRSSLAIGIMLELWLLINFCCCTVAVNDLFQQANVYFFFAIILHCLESCFTNLKRNVVVQKAAVLRNSQNLITFKFIFLGFSKVPLIFINNSLFFRILALFGFYHKVGPFNLSSFRRLE